MGMYTQIRGWLNINSIGSKMLLKNEVTFKKAQLEFSLLSEDKGERKWVCEDTIIYTGSNCSQWIFIGSEYKNYDKSMDNWIDLLLKFFPMAEGRIDYQYEEEHIGGKSRYLLIRGGTIIKDSYCETWCIGYGNVA